MAVVRDSANGRRFLLFVNDGTTAPPTTGPALPITLSVSLAPWGLAPGVILPARSQLFSPPHPSPHPPSQNAGPRLRTLTPPPTCAFRAHAQVSVAAANSYGEVQQYVTVPASGPASISVPANSVIRLTAPISGAVQGVVPLNPAADTTVRAGGAASANFGTLPTLAVSTNAGTNHTATAAAFLRFAVPSTVPASQVTASVLELTVAQAPSQTMIMSLYGVPCTAATAAAGAAAWGDQSLTWTTAGFAFNTSRTPASAAVTSVSQNWVRTDNFTLLAGHITVVAGTAVGAPPGGCWGRSLCVSFSLSLSCPAPSPRLTLLLLPPHRM